MENHGFNWLNVLLIDDSKTILAYVRKVLEENYHLKNIFTATSAADGMLVLQQPNHINLLFLDLNMPNIDGIQLLSQIAELDYKGYIVIMSGTSLQVVSSVEILAKEYDLNYIGTLLKPLNESDFEKIFAKIGNSRSKQQEIDTLRDYEIIRALKNNDIEVLYQPQVDINTKEFIGVEALCRMHHPRLGLVSPNLFINKAEESELIVHITLAVLNKSLADWKKWYQHGINIKLAVNASPIILQQADFTDTVLKLLHQHNVPSNRLCIEVTEGVLAQDKKQELVNLNRLNLRGVEIALDDFGQENSTLERLQKLPLTYLKLDKSYFIDQKESLAQRSLINTSISIANKLNIKTIAEGVEDNDVLHLVTELGCDIAQGFYIGKPMAAKDILPWYRQWHANT